MNINTLTLQVSYTIAPLAIKKASTSVLEQRFPTEPSMKPGDLHFKSFESFHHPSNSTWTRRKRKKTLFYLYISKIHFHVIYMHVCLFEHTHMHIFVYIFSYKYPQWFYKCTLILSDYIYIISCCTRQLL